MKKVLCLIAICIPMGLLATETHTIVPDTTLYMEGKKIQIKEGEDRMKVRVYDLPSNGEEQEQELVFEGHYKGGQSYERRKHGKSITIPLPYRNRSFDAHWVGLGVGFANFADKDLHVNDIDGVSLNSGKSLEYNLNFFEHDFRLSKRYAWAVVTGVGIRWSRYRLDGDKHFRRVDGTTLLELAPEGIHYSASKLNITSLTIPILLEWQNRRRYDNDFFISAGIVGVIKTASSSRIVYRDENGKKRKEKMDTGLYIRPINMDFLLQMGYSWIGLYMKYSPFELFENDKGPKIHPVSIGLQLHI
ncbi:PorT family protein [Parabacteroides sp. 52]|uniref:outer membrane beta-barrel protein n=1 Tax=unclassified Parabacteroides TaxID=2649774 RepID=UPI0013D2CB16|nr:MULTISPECIES: outer membrane beta-barrel protein [unclassified Parabacteroides]MDH6534286.1 hypothetical protein [Parabacteroides sp. PM5-20]NDV55330.1 PorT family protein [Parabacteroides sp. 52]